MVTEHPDQRHIPGLRQLWKLAFGDTDAFLDGFFTGAYSPRRCCCISHGDTVMAALYWFDCRWQGRKLAYLYAVATHPDWRNRGLCRSLMTGTHEILAGQGYSGALLVPQEPGLVSMYGALGYETCTWVGETAASAGQEPVFLRTLDTQTYARLRRQYLPEDGVIQEGENLALLESMARFYAGEDFLLAAAEQNGSLWGMELLGNTEAAPGILRALGYSGGTFRHPGDGIPFGMFLPLGEEKEHPGYFGLALD